MGRRKIEIQPITHERNRSVTFLKRKNGLFKKAYELGVLCSVDVTVIIFEKAGTHNEKLYEYCSSNDSDGQVSKRIDWDGERDARGPADFGGEKHQHPGLLVPSAGQDYDDDDDGDGDGDADGDSDDTKEPKRKKPLSSKVRRSSTSDELSTAAPRHGISHPPIPTPISTYIPGATIPVSDQRDSAHSSTPTSAHPPKRPRRESSSYPAHQQAHTHVLSTPILPNPPLITNPHQPSYYHQEDPAYRALFGNIPGAGGGTSGVSAAPQGHGQYPPYAAAAQQAYRRPSGMHIPGGSSGGGNYGAGPGHGHGHGHGHSGPAYHPPQYPQPMFPTGPFASLIAASGAGGGAGGSAQAGGGGAGSGFELEWPVHGGQAQAQVAQQQERESPGQQQQGTSGAQPPPPPPPPGGAAAAAPPQQQQQPHASPSPHPPGGGPPAPQPNGTTREGGKASGGGGEETDDATSWLDYLAAGIPARRGDAGSGPGAAGAGLAARELEVENANPTAGAGGGDEQQQQQQRGQSASGSEQGTPRKRKHESLR